MTTDNRELILRSLNAALHSKKLYPPGHPSVAAPARKACQLLSNHLDDRGEVGLLLVEESLVFDEIPVDNAREQYGDLTAHLEKKRIEAIRFRQGVTEEELSGLLDILTMERTFEPDELEEELLRRRITRITIRSEPVEKRNMLEVYNDAVGVVKNVMNDVRMGRIPKSGEVTDIVDEMTDLVFADTNAMIGLAMIKSYDEYLYNHSVNVSILGIALGRFMKLGKHEIHIIGVAALLHDVGKTGVSEEIIKKPGGLSSEEWEKVKQHPVLGSQIVERMDGMEKDVCRMIYEHHVRYDHSGYPKIERSIHPLGMIISVADAYDALTTLRVYQNPHQPVDAVKILKDLAGRHFDPAVVDAFERMIGFYPVGTMIRLDTNEVGVVIKVNHEACDMPTVKILYDSDGNQLEEPYSVDLAAEGEKTRSIIGVADPLTRNMDMGAFFQQEAG